ncbi:MAG: flippase [candidate division KSB1 bacterium]|nr:flippase [candidate division KSB1 bacterium]
MLERLLKNTAARSLAEVINRLGGALFWLLVARVLGASALGVLAFSLSLFSFFMTLSTLGLGSVLIRDIARHPERTAVYFSHALIIGSVTFLIVAPLMFGLALSLNIMGITLYATGVMALAVLPGCVFYWCKSILTAHEKMKGIAWARTAENAVRLGIGAWLLFTGGTLIHIIWVIFASKVVLAGVGMLLTLRYAIAPRFQWDGALFRYFGSMIPAFSMITLFNSLFWAASVVLLTHFSGETQAGWFGAAFKLVDMIIALSLAYGQAIFPIASRSLQNKSGYRRVFHRSLKYISLLTLAIAAGTTLLAGPLVQFLYGSQMNAAAPVLRILIWCVVPFSLVPVFSSSLVSYHQQNWDLAANAAAALSVIALNLLLQPGTGAVGAAAVLLSACVIFLLVEAAGVQQCMFRLYVPMQLIYALPGVLLMWGVITLTRNTHVLISVVAAAVIYFGFLYFSGALDRTDFKRLLRRKREAGL